MTTSEIRQHGLSAGLGVAGSVLGMVAGTVQATIGDRIPEWTGAKASPTALGLLTVALSALAGVAAIRQRVPALTVGARAACALAMAGAGLLCLSTVGRLWYPSAVLLVLAGVLTIDSWKETATAFAEEWWRVLLSVLGGCEILMAAGAAPMLMVVGALGGIALIAGAWLRTASAGAVIGLVVVGTVPFAALAGSAIVPVLLAVVAAVVAVPVVRQGMRVHASYGGGSR